VLRRLWPWRRSTRTRTEPEETVALTAERRRRRVRRALLALGPALVVIVGGYVSVTGGRYVETDDAFVKADMVELSAQVSGPIVEVSVRENQHVETGQVLFRIDPEPFRIALAQAEARLH
jgi:membrane fusion protein (multidrug efflux system)